MSKLNNLFSHEATDLLKKQQKEREKKIKQCKQDSYRLQSTLMRRNIYINIHMYIHCGFGDACGVGNGHGEPSSNTRTMLFTFILR